MKIKGRKLDKPQVEVCVIPRHDGDIVFKAQPVVDFTDFVALCPMPQAPVILKRGGTESRDVEDKDYKAALDKWAEQRTDWMIIKSLQATEELEWETVNVSDPSTWSNFRLEFEKSGLTGIEVNAVISIVIDACGLNQKKIEEATKRFLAGQVPA
jgi:hypothetical protein